MNLQIHTKQDIYLLPSDVLEYCYCPRFIYFERVMHIPQHEEQRYKVLEGRELHHRRKLQNPDYLRKRLSVIKKKEDVWMASKKYPIKGRVDEVLFLSDGTSAPMDYKFAEWKGRIFFNHRMQSALYGLLIKENFAREVKRGFIVYTRSKNHIEEIPLGDAEFSRAIGILDEILEIIQKGRFPKRTHWRVRCVDCCYRNICIH